MAPQASRIMKRPAAQVSSSSAPSPKKRLLSRRAGDVSSSFLDAIKDELPTSAIMVLAGIIEKYAPQGDSLLCDTPLQDYEKKAMSLASKALASLETKLGDDVVEVQAKFEQVESEKITRVRALEVAEVGVAKAKDAIAQAKSTIKSSAKSIESARGEVKKAKAAQKNAVDHAQIVVAKVEQLDAIDKNAFQPLRENSVKGSSDKKKLQRLREVGKRLEFHDVLLNTTMPKVLMKRLDKRQTFDRFVLDQVELEFDKKRLQLETSLQQQESTKRDREAAALTAQQNLVDSEQQRSAELSELKEAEISLASRKKSVVLARQAVRSIETESRGMADNLSRAEKLLDAFRTGPSTGFKTLEMAILAILSPAVPSPGRTLTRQELKAKLSAASLQNGKDECAVTGTQRREEKSITKVCSGEEQGENEVQLQDAEMAEREEQDTEEVEGDEEEEEVEEVEEEDEGEDEIEQNGDNVHRGYTLMAPQGAPQVHAPP
jgi:hypothetical protein